jgi:FkbM family methyltransferase
MNPPLKLRLQRARRRLAESVGIARYSRPALHELDRKLERYLPERGGFFIEAGANDGYAQSNTYYFERLRGWRGLLIEPIPELCARCRAERPRSKVVQAALVAPDFGRAEIEMQFAGLMSVSEGAFGDAAVREQHVEAGLRQPGVPATYRVRTPARPLSAIIDEVAPGQKIDLFCLDVEGAELTALAGLDLARHRPRFICVEAREPAAVKARLESCYDAVAVLSDNGTHQDLLFRCR